MRRACVSRRGTSLLGALIVGIITIGFVAGVSAAANPPTSAYAEPYPRPTPDAASKTFVEAVARAAGTSAKELSRGIVVAQARAKSKPERKDGQISPPPKQPPRVVAVPDDRLLARAGVDASGGGLGAHWSVLLAGLLAVAGLTARFAIQRRTTSSTIE